MEYRVYVRVPGIAIESDAAGRLLDDLHAHYRSYGPVLDGAGDGDLNVTLATDAETPSRAVMTMMRAVGLSMIRTGLGDHYPTSIELEPIDEPAAQSV